MHPPSLILLDEKGELEQIISLAQEKSEPQDDRTGRGFQDYHEEWLRRTGPTGALTYDVYLNAPTEMTGFTVSSYGKVNSGRFAGGLVEQFRVYSTVAS